MTNTRAVATRSVRPAATDWTRPTRTASTTVEHNDRPCHENKITGGWVFPPDLSHELRYTTHLADRRHRRRHRPSTRRLDQSVPARTSATTHLGPGPSQRRRQAADPPGHGAARVATAARGLVSAV